MGSSSPPAVELQTRVRQQEVVADLGQQALATDDLDRLMHDAAAAVAETLDVEYAKVLELLPGGEEVLLRQGVGWRDGLVGTETVPTDLDSQAGYTLLSEEPVIVEDLHTEERFSGPELLTSHDVVSGISVVIGSAEDPWGVLGTHDTEHREFTEDDATFVQSVANILASAIERVEREQELRRTERHFQAVFEDPNILVGLLAPDGTVLDINETALEYIDADLETVTGEPVWETPWWGENDAIQNDVREWTGRAAAGEYVDFEADLTRPNGQQYTVSGYFRPVTDDDGEVVSIILSDRDVTERKRRERELSESERRYRTLAENFPNGIVTLFDQNLRYELAAGRAFEDIPVEPADVEGHHFTEVWEEATAEALRPAFEAALDGEEKSVELTYVGRDWVVHAVPITDERGDVFAGMTMAQDITERKASQRQLETVNDRLTRYKEYTGDVLDTVDDIFYLLDADGELQRWNESLHEVTGYSADEIAAMHALDFFDEGERDPIASAIAEGFETGHVQVEAELLTKDGEHVPYEFVASTLADPDGKPVLAGVGRDVTDRVERERAIEESEARFRMLAENLEEMVWVSDLETREILYINPAFEEIWGRDREFLYDDPTRFLDDVHPDDRERVEQAYAAVPEEGFDEEYRIVRPDGEVRWVDVRAGTARSEGRERVVGIAEDVTERTEREQALEESERRYRTLAENFPNGAVGLFNEDLEYTAVGGQLLDAIEVDPEDRIGSIVYDIYPEELVEEIEPYFHAALEGDANSFEAEYHDRHLLAHTIPVRNADDVVFAGMLVVQDVTEQREYERRLEESNERLEQFAYAASHDLQEPLRMVSSYLQLLERRYADEFDEDGRDFIEFAVDGADRMRGIIDGLLEYSRVESRGDPFEPVDLDDALADVRDDLQMKIEESDATITVGDLPTVEGDNGQLRQVFQNLLDNAIEYSGDEPPRVYVGAERLDDQWKISVCDEGVGIDPADADRVFEVFQSLHGHDESGTGIGLALVERIVERHGGDVWVDSLPGEGATFSFTLPAAGDSTGRPQQ